MLKAKIEEIKALLNKNHKSIETMKIYSNHTPINDVINIIKEKLPKGIRASAIAVYFALEGHSNTKCEVNAAQSLIASEIGLSREYVNFLIGQLHEAGIIVRKRRGLKQVNLYILTVKKAIVDIVNELKEIYIQMQKEKKKKNQKENFNNYDQRSYNFDELEKGLTGQKEIDDMSTLYT